MIRSIAVWTYVVLSTVFWAIAAILATVIRPRSPQRLCLEVGRRWSRGILRASRARVRVEGLDNLDPEAPNILVSNHESWYDVWAILAEIPGCLLFVAKKELGRIPFFGSAWQRCGHISVDRGDRASAIESLDRGADQVRRLRGTVVVFPEGTRTRTGELQPFKKGAFVLALKAGVPVVPMGIAGSRAVLAKGGWRVRPGEIRLRIGRPIPTAGMTAADRDELLEMARVRVAALRREAAEALAAAADSRERGVGRAPGR